MAFRVQLHGLPLLASLAAVSLSAADANVTIRAEGTSLRASCYGGSAVLAELPGGAAARIRFSLVGDGATCYKIAVETADGPKEGYVRAGGLDGLETFQKAQRQDVWPDVSAYVKVLRSQDRKAAPRVASGGAPASLVESAMSLIEAGQPNKALQALEPQLGGRPDASLYAMAGVAAWKADDTDKALAYLEKSLKLAPNAEIAGLYDRVAREARSDQSGEKLYGTQVVLRYQSGAVPEDDARRMLDILDAEFASVSEELGCHAEERVVAIAQSREAYRRTTNAAEWSGGQFDGRIRVPFSAERTPSAEREVRRALAHEMTHACLSMLGRWPAWLQEGLAQRLSGDTVNPGMRLKLMGMAREGKLPPLEALNQDWSRLDTEHALAAYAQSLAAVDLLYDRYSGYGIRNLLRNPPMLAQVTAQLDRDLALVSPQVP